MRLRASDLRHVLEFVGELSETQTEEAFPSELLGRLARIVPAEGVVFQERDLLAGELVDDSGWCAVEDDLDATDDDDPSGADSWEFVRHHPVNVHRRRTGFTGALANSDFWSRSARLRYDVFAPEYHARWGVVDMAGVRLSGSRTHTATIFAESSERDFTARDKTVLDVLRPHLVARHRDARLRRLVADALATLDTASESARTPAVVLVGSGNRVEFASPAAVAMLAEYFGGEVGDLPQPLAAWRRQGSRDPFTVRSNGHRLVVEPVGPGRSSLVLREEHALRPPLTAREWEVMRSVEAGKTNDEIAELLSISAGTVRKHLEHVYDKLGVRSRTAALARLRPWLSGTTLPHVRAAQR